MTEGEKPTPQSAEQVDWGVVFCISLPAYTYNSAQELTKATNSNNESYSYTYDSTYKHRLTAARSNQLGNGFVYSYDSFGNIIGTKMGTVSTYGVLNTNQPYIESTTGYDSTGNYATSVSDQRGNTTTYNINLLTGLTNSITDPSGTTTNYSYDNITLLLEAVTSGGASVSYVYDDFNRLTQIQHNGFTYHFAYDKFGNTSTVKVGDQTLVTNVYESGNEQLQSGDKRTVLLFPDSQSDQFPTGQEIHPPCPFFVQKTTSSVHLLQEHRN